MSDIKITYVWLLMIVVSLMMLVSSGNSYSAQVVTTGLLIAAWFKGQMIIDHFMGLRYVERKWRRVVSLWLLIVILAIYGIYQLS